MKTVKEVSRLTGVSVRTLHYYDAIGLLSPAEVTSSGYRLYDDAAIQRLHSILLFRELQFPLKEIKMILDNPDFDPDEALTQQIKMLELQYQHMGELISYAREIKMKGVKNMDFTEFENERFDLYKQEVKERWGDTEAYRESQQRQPGKNAAAQMNEIFAQFAQLRHLSPESEKVQSVAAKLHNHINENYYTCPKELFAQVGALYVSDERFRKNIDGKCGEGTAEFASQAVSRYCKN